MNNYVREVMLAQESSASLDEIRRLQGLALKQYVLRRNLLGLKRLIREYGWTWPEFEQLLLTMPELEGRSLQYDLDTEKYITLGEWVRRL